MARRIAERVYATLPACSQNLALSIFGLKYRWERLGGGFRTYVREYEMRERWDPEQLHLYSQDRLRMILRSAFRASHYRSLWEDAGLQEGDIDGFHLEDLTRLPLTNKEQLRSNPLDFVTHPTKHPRYLIEQQTSGSTGIPVKIFMSLECLRETVAAREARSFKWAGVSLRLPRATIGARLIIPRPNARPPFYRYNLVERQIYLSSFHISPGNVANYVEGLNRFRPQVLTGMAHSYYLLSRLMLQLGLQLNYRPRAAILGSEKVTTRVRDTVKEAFRTRVFEEYGSVENCGLATQCEVGNLHVSPDYGIVEIVDKQGKAVPPGVPGRVVCTGLFNHYQPLIRYEIGDVATWSDGACHCGRSHMPVLQSIVGRLNDVIMLADGRHIVGTDEIFSGIDGVAEGQVVQNSVRDFTLRVVAMPDFGKLQEDQLRDALKKRAGEVCVKVEKVDQLERTSAGKFKPVVSLVTGWSPGDEDLPPDTTAGIDFIDC